MSNYRKICEQTEGVRRASLELLSACFQSIVHKLIKEPVVYSSQQNEDREHYASLVYGVKFMIIFTVTSR